MRFLGGWLFHGSNDYIDLFDLLLHGFIMCPCYLGAQSPDTLTPHAPLFFRFWHRMSNLLLVTTNERFDSVGI